MGPLLRQVADEGHLKIITLIIAGLEATGGPTANASNIELPVDLVVLDLVHKVINCGVKIARVLVMVSLEGKLGLWEGGVCDAIQKMVDTSAGVIGSIIGLLCQCQHGLIRSLVAFHICSKHEPTLWPIVTNVLNGFLQLCNQCVFCPSAKESIIQLPPCCTKLGVNVELVNVDLSFGPLHNAFQFLEASYIVFHCLMGIKLQGGFDVQSVHV